jgi:uncharacterized lipoprotein YajG
VTLNRCRMNRTLFSGLHRCVLFAPTLAVASLLLAGCASAPNDPTLTLQTRKTPAQYADCVVPKLQAVR